MGTGEEVKEPVPKEPIPILIKKSTRRTKDKGDILCSKCDEPFDPYKIIKYVSGEKALSTCPYCGKVMKVHKILPAGGYLRTVDGWRREHPKVHLSKKDRRKLRKEAV